MKQALIYTLKVWLTTIVVSSVISMIVQSCILLPRYHLSKNSNHIYDWLLQLGGTSIVNAILFLPMGVVLLAVAMMYSRRKAQSKTGLYVATIISCLLPSLGMMFYMFKSGDFTSAGAGSIGMSLDILTFTFVALVCARRFELNNGISKHILETTDDLQQ